MKIDFFKFQGTGNDFILIDIRNKNKETQIQKENHFLKKLCDRHFGIGADGIIFIKNDSKSDFYMKYYNSDGKESTMCGNGGRCAVSFSRKLEITKKNKIYFKAVDGYHYGIIKNKDLISVKLLDIDRNMIKKVANSNNHVFLNTGSPHHIFFIKEKDIKKIDVFKRGKIIRFHNFYSKIGGVNVNFVKILKNNILQVRTYERGVENETLSCGTGIVASVIAAYEINEIKKNHSEKKNTHQEFLVHTFGGKLWVSFQKTQNKYKEIYLTGSVKFVFKGCINLMS
ncbi:diaminopimelate epimerase [Blattabacterium cuenoti]|uniref:diaminopimelate epimerase n=1 Tax=Blattabacterium cuenoti TaxID=1653831 RepID=UPI00163C1F70|nr:diaminopimelate epimerase [Blattabacterium cuenoti]